MENNDNPVKKDILEKAQEALERAKAAKLDATLEVKKWEEFIREFTKSSN